MKRITIIGGGGKMGVWMARFLRDAGLDVTICDTDGEKLAAAGRSLGVDVKESLAGAVSGADYIILSVPIEGFEAAVAALAPYLEKGQEVIDITSTKTVPVEIMHRHITGNTVLGAHPLFGPGAGAVLNKNVVLTPTAPEETAVAGRIASFLKDKGARVSVMSPQEHDRMMSLILGLSHFIALVTADTLLGSGTLHPMEAAGSSTYKVLLTLVESVLSEDPDLYASIQMSLPNVSEYETSFLEKTGEWAELVARKDRGEFAARMQALKERLETVSPGYRDSYEKMYRIVEGL
jgi:prephenate dehydrogenase